LFAVPNHCSCHDGEISHARVRDVFIFCCIT
jgi:hypothetical protein